MAKIAGSGSESGSGSTPTCHGSATLGVTRTRSGGEEPVELRDGHGDGGEAFTF
jgi:hypothetical protein